MGALWECPPAARGVWLTPEERVFLRLHRRDREQRGVWYIIPMLRIFC